MSVRPRRADAEEEEPGGAGFLFAFYLFSQAKDTSFLERLVQTAVRIAVTSDIIHVAVVPVTQYRVCEIQSRTVSSVVVSDRAYTSFIYYGFESQPVDNILTEAYEYLFVPVHDEADMAKGMDFLLGLKGAGYNYGALPLTLLPSMMKHRIHSFPSFMTKEDPSDHDYPLGWHHAIVEPMHPAMLAHTRDPLQHRALLAAHFREEEGAPESETDTTRTPRVFCSQMGLMLCKLCGILDTSMDAATCTPGELARLLWDQGGALYCPRGSISVCR
jgi:hypothetical protein